MKSQTKPVQLGLSALLIVLAAAGLPAQAQYAGGAGTADDPYRIETAEQLNAIGLSPEDWDKHFRLTANIDMNDLGGAKVNLIETFGGIFDGDGHTISNLTYLVRDEDVPPEAIYVLPIGLFRMVTGFDALVKDLGLVNPDLRPAPTCTKQVRYMGALVGILIEGWVRNCYVDGGHVVGSSHVGGLVGWCRDYAAVSESWSSTDVSGTGTIGGLIGGTHGPVEIWLCHTKARVSGWSNIGGLAGGCTLEGMIDECFTTGTVEAQVQAGGLVGSLGGSVSNCYSTAGVSGYATLGGLVGINSGLIGTSWAGGEIAGGSTVGGLVGTCMIGDGFYVPYFDTTVVDSYAAGPVHGDSVVGGLIGGNYGKLLRCYAVGPVTGSKAGSILGGLVAKDWSVPQWDVLDCFWDTIATGVSVSGGGIGKTTAEMQDMGTYLAASWDFAGETANGTDDLWKMSDDGPAYPKLAWEKVSAATPADPNDAN